MSTLNTAEHPQVHDENIVEHLDRHDDCVSPGDCKTPGSSPEDCSDEQPASVAQGDSEVGAMASVSSKAEENSVDVQDKNLLFDRFAQRMKSDLMYELRNIQHGERPVTGQGHRDRLRQFMLRYQDNKGGNSPAPVEDTERHRPQGIVVEVQGMIERRPVSSMLNSLRFRRQLEGVIRDGMVGARSCSSSSSSGSFTNRLPDLPQRPVQSSASSEPVSSAATSTVSQVVARPTPGVSVPEVSPALQRSDSLVSVDSFASAMDFEEDQMLSDSESDSDVARVTSSVSQMERQVAPVEQPRLENVNTQRDAPLLTHLQRESLFSTIVDGEAPASLRQDARSSPPASTGRRSSIVSLAGSSSTASTRESVASHAAHQNDNGPTLWDDISEHQRDELVHEISELLHRRLVSSSLSSEFRATLELQAQQHILASGMDGHRVQESINSLPPSGIQRNDFSHLGISAGNDQPLLGDLFDDIENLSARLSPIVFGDDNNEVEIGSGIREHIRPQSFSQLGREFSKLRSEFDKVKSIVQMTFDLQMELQRSLRQEVSAAMNGASYSGATHDVPSPRPSRPLSESQCLICLDKPSDSVFYRCGHICVCFACGRELLSRKHNCPVCRAPIKDVVRVFVTDNQ